MAPSKKCFFAKKSTSCSQMNFFSFSNSNKEENFFHKSRNKLKSSHFVREQPFYSVGNYSTISGIQKTFFTRQDKIIASDTQHFDHPHIYTKCGVIRFEFFHQFWWYGPKNNFYRFLGYFWSP